ncbi:MAG: chorismate mutase [Candidatus Levybacteria bacterium]|nr:chorismate mutase [Candidatus Levybacteria bacterium]
MKDLKKLRVKIDKLDDELLEILSKRIEIVREIGKMKRKNHLPLFDKKRWEEILKSKLSKSKSLNLSEKFIEKLYAVIHEHSLEIEKEEK